jgi:hypothetical protein
MRVSFKAMARRRAATAAPRAGRRVVLRPELLIMAEKGGWKLKEVPVAGSKIRMRVRFPQDIIKMAAS